MSEKIGQRYELWDLLVELLAADAVGITDEWLATDAFPAITGQTVGYAAQVKPFSVVLSQAMRNLRQGATAKPVEIDAALRGAWPALVHPRALLTLARILTDRLHQLDCDVDSAAVLQHLQQGIATLPTPNATEKLFNERLGRLNQLSWMLNSQRDQDSIMHLALREAPALIGAESSAIWLWDIDQQAPIMLVTASDQVSPSATPPRLLQFLRQTCESCSAFSIDAGESDDSWPVELHEKPIAFIPLPTKDGCLGILTIHHSQGMVFSHDDILLLSSLGNLTATALHNVQLNNNERHLIGLLQTSIRQVVRSAANQQEGHEDFIHSLLHVAEGLTHARAVSASLSIDHAAPPLLVVSGALATAHHDILLTITQQLAHAGEQRELPPLGRLRDALPTVDLAGIPPHYALAGINLRAKPAGMVVALSDAPFHEDQQTFLQTVAEQIGVGVDNRQQSADMQRLLFELSNVNYVSETISSTFDQHRIFTIISQAAAQALNAPIALCGWLEDDGSIRVLPDTTVGIPEEIATQHGLTFNNSVIRTVLDQRVEVTSRQGARKSRAVFPKLKSLAIRDWVCVPMMVKPKARGIMLVADVRPRDFSRREIALISTYANQAALAMENSLLYEQVGHQLRQMEQLYQVTRSVSSTLDLDAILQGLLHAATEALQLPVGFIGLADDASGIQRIVASTGLEQQALDAVRIEPGEGILGMVGQRGAPIVSSHLARDGRSAFLRRLARAEKLAASLTVPMQVQGRVLGTLTVISREAREFTPAHEQLLHAMAMEAAVAVQNATLYTQERERARALRVLVEEVTGRVNTTLDLVRELLSIARETESSTLGIERTRQRLESLAAVQAGITEENPAQVDLTNAMTHYLHERCLRMADDTCSPQLQIIGAHLILPSRPASALALLIHEWISAAIAAQRDPASMRLTIAFQQFGRDILIQAEYPVTEQEEQGSINHAIIALVTRIVPGTMTETIEEGLHRIRFRFNRLIFDAESRNASQVFAD